MTEEENNKFTQELLVGSEPITEEFLHELIRKVVALEEVFAMVLAENMDKVKLPDLAKLYEKSYERHFSHDWHVSELTLKERI